MDTMRGLPAILDYTKAAGDVVIFDDCVLWMIAADSRWYLVGSFKFSHFSSLAGTAMISIDEHIALFFVWETAPFLWRSIAENRLLLRLRQPLVWQWGYQSYQIPWGQRLRRVFGCFHRGKIYDKLVISPQTPRIKAVHISKKVENWETNRVKRRFVIKDQRILSLWARSMRIAVCRGPRNNKMQNFLASKCPRFCFDTYPQMILLNDLKCDYCRTRTWMIYDHMNHIATGQNS